MYSIISAIDEQKLHGNSELNIAIRAEIKSSAVKMLGIKNLELGDYSGYAHLHRK